MNVTCIFCDQRIQVASDHPTTDITCPKCGKEFPLPSAQQVRASTRDYDDGSGPWWRPGLSGIVSFCFHAALLAIFSLITWASYDLGGLGEEVQIGELPAEKLGNQGDDELDAPDEDVDQSSELDETFEVVTPPTMVFMGAPPGVKKTVAGECFRL